MYPIEFITLFLPFIALIDMANIDEPASISADWLTFQLSGDCPLGLIGCYPPDYNDPTRKLSRRFRPANKFEACGKDRHGIKVTDQGQSYGIETALGSWEIGKNVVKDDQISIKLDAEKCSAKCLSINGTDACSEELGNKFSAMNSPFGQFLDDFAGFWLLTLENGTDLEPQNSGNCTWKIDNSKSQPKPEPCSEPKWMAILPAKVKLENGSEELTVRIGFLESNESGKAHWNNTKIKSFILNHLPGVLNRTDLDFAEFFYAPLSPYFDETINKTLDNKKLQAYVFNCTFGMVVTNIRTAEDQEGHNVADKRFDWSKDSAEVNECKQVYATFAPPIKRNIHGQTTFPNITVKSNEPFTVGLDKDQLNNEGIDARVFKQAHKYKFGFLPPEKKLPHPKGSKESGKDSLYQLVKEMMFTEVYGGDKDMYESLLITNFTAHFRRIDQKMIECANYKEANDKGGQGAWLWKGCEPKGFCENNKTGLEKFCESIDADAKCGECADKDKCNGKTRKCYATKQRLDLNYGFIEMRKDDLMSLEEEEMDHECERDKISCVTELCEGEKEYRVRKGCQPANYCKSKVKKQRKDAISLCEEKEGNLTCHPCETDNCNLLAVKCQSTDGKYEKAKTEGTVVGKPDHSCPPNMPLCVTQICTLENGTGTINIWKGCGTMDYCQDDKSKQHNESCAAKNGTYQCRSCHSKHNCNNGTTEQIRKCWSTNGAFLDQSKEDEMSAKLSQDCNSTKKFCMTESCQEKGGRTMIRKGCVSKESYCNSKNVKNEKEKCKKNEGIYKCTVCGDTDNCNRVLNCFATENKGSAGYSGYKFTKTNIEFDDVTENSQTVRCPDEHSCVTQTCIKRATRWMGFGIQALTYTCPGKTGDWAFKLPHFTGVILDISEPRKPKLIRSNQHTKFTIKYYAYTNPKEWNNPRVGEVNQGDPEKCKNV